MESRSTSTLFPLTRAASAPSGAASDSRKAAEQLEGAFAKLMIQAMRKTTLGDDSLFPGQSGQFRDLYDQQLADLLAQGRGLGLKAAIQAQLDQAQAPAATPARPVAYSLAAYRQALGPALSASPLDGLPGARPAPAAGDDWFAAGHATAAAAKRSTPNVLGAPAAPATPAHDAVAAADRTAVDAGSPEQFVASIWPHAQRAASELGVPARTLVAQAALETGWGRSLPRGDDGQAGHNLFGIKAGSRWAGRIASHGTQEFEQGQFRQVRADFRAYASPADSFRDYVALLKSSPRYADALNSGGDGRRFAQSLQSAGYATDPRYAEKLDAIANGPTMNRALARIESGATLTET
ncbi:MAG: flagellar assembly peptidoglycan hydrolase FlgJ [Xanthomonadaceae bacterium]|nr:flagellar assembly peptidoglycan hydrolase FlgJ [Xanthomonadaceae bacterium]